MSTPRTTKATIYPVGPKKRSVPKLEWIILTAIIGLGTGWIYELSGPTHTEQGTVIRKYIRSGKTSSHTVEITLSSGPNKGEMVRDDVGMMNYEYFAVGDHVRVETTEGRLTGLLHADKTKRTSRP